MSSSFDCEFHLGIKFVFQRAAWNKTIYVYAHVVEEVGRETIQRLYGIERNG